MMNDENTGHPIACRAARSSRRDLQHLWARHAAEFDAMRHESHVPQIPSTDNRAKLVGLHPPVQSEGRGDHEGAKVVIYIPDNGRDAGASGEPAASEVEE